PKRRLFANDLGGGGILDVGCYPVSACRLLAGAACGEPFIEPVEIKGMGVLHPETGVDEYATGLLRFPNNILAQISTGVALAQDNNIVVFGSKGRLEIPTPWFGCGREGGEGTLLLHAKGEVQTIKVHEERWLYAIEADTAGEAILAGKTEAPAMSHADSLGNMRVLDQWRRGIGLIYEVEKYENATYPTITRSPLRKAPDAPMVYGQVPHLDKQVSRLVMGCDNQNFYPHAALMFDSYFEAGGNCFDTAWIYGGGLPERILGTWIRQRGVREEVCVLVKGAHTPLCDPQNLISQFNESLDRLGLEYADLYCMHRDNPQIPVGEFIDALNQLCNEGRLRAFGGSNWSLERIIAANEYAAAHGLRSFDFINNNFSLAKMVQPVWNGCISAASEPEQRAWLERTQTPLFSWSSQARGFFTDRAGRDKFDDPSLARCWYSEENFARRDRAYELAAKKGVEPINIALAYVLHQKFPVFALIGPRSIAELNSCLRALSVSLSDEEVRWLENGDR
ncbi:MAG: oxidoreductase, partial [Lentisphaerae bacterium]